AVPGGNRLPGGRDARGPRGEQASGRPQEGSCQVALFWQTVVAMMKAPLSISRRTFMTQSACAAALGAATLPMARSETAGKIKIGQIGTTHSHAAGKMGAIRWLDDFYEVVGVVEPDEERRETLKDQEPYQGLNWMSEEELLKLPGLEAVAVETEVKDLVATARRCVEAGVHIHLDKPAGTSLAACRTLHEEANARGVTIQMGYMLRYNPAFQFLFKAVDQGCLGPITEMMGMMGKSEYAAVHT